MNTSNKILNIVSYIALFGVSLVFGLLNKTTEMGLAIVAGSLGLAFVNIDKLKRFKGAGFEAEMQDKIEAIVDKETEPGQKGIMDNCSSSVEGYIADEKSKKVLKALFNPTYTWRYTESISLESDLLVDEVSKALNRLLSNNLVSSSQGDHGTLWCLTAKGRNIFRNMDK